MEKKNLVFLNPHYSSGGSCAYINKMAEGFKERFNIHIIEKSFAGEEFTVHRKQAEKLYNFHSCYGDDSKLIPIINNINPSILHIHEVPETFLPSDVLSQLYSNNRKYNIVVTSHSSLSRRKDFRYIPDKIIAVNKWQQDLFKEEFPEIPVGIWEYPIEDKHVSLLDKQEAKISLGFDKGINIISVGLFTPGKNQKEVFQVAKELPGVTFHFIGNQAGNFREYWEPLMKEKPNNCIVWGERADVDNFYKSADMVYFASTYELWPLVLREALSYKLPTLCRKLPSYLDEYDNNAFIKYIDNDIQKTINIIDEYITTNRN